MGKSREVCGVPVRFWLSFLFFLSISFIIISIAQSEAVTVKWDPNSEADVRGYKIYYGLNSSNYSNSIDVGAQTTATISGLESGKTYYFAATAYDAANESGYSEEIFHQVLDQDSDNDGISDADEASIYGTDPDNADTDGDGINDAPELSYWGENWNKDIDGDNIINLLDKDSDNDSILDGAEIENGSDPSIPDGTNGLPLMEFGDITVDNNWVEVKLKKPFKDPIVVAGAASLNDDDPGVVRIRHVTTAGFEICFQEWDYLDSKHFQEKVSYIVIEKGRYILEDGTRIEADYFDTDKTKSFEKRGFVQKFNKIPVIMTAICTYNEAEATAGRIRNVSQTDFEYKLQEQQVNPKNHAMETISYIAWEPSIGIVEGVNYEIGKTEDIVKQDVHTISFFQIFKSAPALMLDMQTTDGGNTANIRWQDKNESAVSVCIDEEQSADSETNHTTEVVGYMAFVLSDKDSDRDTIIDSDEINIYGTDPENADSDGDGLLDGVELAYWGNNWNGDHDSDGYINLLDPDSDNDSFLDGVEVANGYNPLDSNSRSLVPTMEIGEVVMDQNWVSVDFRKYYSLPVVVARSLSRNDNEPAVIRIRNVTRRGFEICLKEWDYLDGIHSPEKIGYLVMERGIYVLEDGTLIEAESFDSDSTESFIKKKFVQPFNLTPVVISTITTDNELDTVTGRVKKITNEQFKFKLQEQQFNTPGHAQETISYIAWEPSSGIAGEFNFAVNLTENIVSHGLHTITFNPAFQKIPVFLSEMQTADGGDVANIRWQNKDEYAVDVSIDEEQSADNETNHTTEVVGYFAIVEIK